MVTRQMVLSVLLEMRSQNLKMPEPDRLRGEGVLRDRDQCPSCLWSLNLTTDRQWQICLLTEQVGQWSGRKCLIVEVIVSSQGEATLPKTLHLHLLPCVFLPTLPPMRKAFLPAPHSSLPSRNHIETHLSTCMCTNTQAFTCIPAHTETHMPT